MDLLNLGQLVNSYLVPFGLKVGIAIRDAADFENRHDQQDAQCDVCRRGGVIDQRRLQCPRGQHAAHDLDDGVDGDAADHPDNDNVRVIVGNNKLFSGTITNYSANPVRRADLRCQIAYGVDPAQAIARMRSRRVGG